MLYARAALNRFNQNTGKVVPLLFSESTGKVSRFSLAGIEPAEHRAADCARRTWREILCLEKAEDGLISNLCAVALCISTDPRVLMLSDFDKLWRTEWQTCKDDTVDKFFGFLRQYRICDCGYWNMSRTENTKFAIHFRNYWPKIPSDNFLSETWFPITNKELSLNEIQ